MALICRISNVAMANPLILRDMTHLWKGTSVDGEISCINISMYLGQEQLQTVASLLRLQPRRVSGTKRKCFLKKTLIRIMGIATVHGATSYSGIETVRMNQVIEKYRKYS